MRLMFVVSLLLSAANYGFAMQCPDPQNSSLAWGEIPAPWELSPFSPNRVQADESTRFVKANILVAGYGQGVACSYRNQVGNFTIWQQARTKRPSRQTPYWVATVGGFVCDAGLVECDFVIVRSCTG